MRIRDFLVMSPLLLLLVGAPLSAQEEARKPVLRFAVLPVLNTLPLYVVLDGGYFDEAGITVEIVDYASGADVQAATIAGELDGFQADLFSALKVNAAGGDVRLVRHVGVTDAPFISLVVGRRSGIESVADFAGKRIGLSKNTIIQYMTDAFLASAELDAGEAGVEYVDVPGIWDRLQQLLDKDIAAATLPAPFSEVSPRWSYRVLIDDSEVAYVPESLNIAAAALAEKGAAVRAFLAAYERAVDTLNEMAGDQSTLREFLRENDRGGGQLLKSSFNTGLVPVPILTRARVPSEAEYSSVHDWALGAGLLAEAQSYADVVDGQFLPEVMEEEMAETDDMAEEAAAPVAEQEMREPDLRFLVRPSINSLPLHVAQDAGYFEEEGVVVEFVDFMNVTDLQAAVEAGESDGLQLTSLNRILQLNAGAGNVRVVREVEVTNLPYFAIITGPGSGIESMDDLTSNPVSLIKGADAEFLVGQMLTHAGLSEDQVEIVYIDSADVGNLMDKILDGQIKVTLVDQVFTQVISTMFGGSVLMDSDDMNYGGAQEMIGFRSQVLEEKGDAVHAFLRAYARAEEAINALAGDTQAYRQFVGTVGMEQDAPIKVIVSGGFAAVPIFAPPGLPSTEDFNPFQEWAIGAGLLERTFSYEELVDGSFMMEEMAEE